MAIRRHSVNLSGVGVEGKISDAIKQLPKGYLKALFIRLSNDKFDVINKSVDQIAEEFANFVQFGTVIVSEKVDSVLSVDEKINEETSVEVSSLPSVESQPTKKTRKRDELSM